MSDGPSTSPNVGRALQKAIRAARLPLAEKALLTQLGLSYHGPSAASRVSRETLRGHMGSDVTLEQVDAARKALQTRGLIRWVNAPQGVKQAPDYTFNLAAIEQLAGDSGKPTSTGQGGGR